MVRRALSPTGSASRPGRTWARAPAMTCSETISDPVDLSIHVSRGEALMKNRAWLIAACMAVGTFTSAGIARQPKQTAKQGKSTSAEPKQKLPAIDEKKLTDPKAAQAAADMLEASFQGKQPPEGVRMLISILRGSRMGAGEGWFGPAQ